MVATCKAYPEEYWFNRTNASFMNIKKCILAVIAVWLMSFHLMASETVAYKVETVPNVRLQDSREYVSDPASLLAAATHDSINAILSRLESSTGIEAAVVMLPSIGEADPFSFSVDLFRRWGIGKKKNDNGLLVLYVEDKYSVTKIRLFLHLLSFSLGKILIFCVFAHNCFTTPNIEPL